MVKIPFIKGITIMGISFLLALSMPISASTTSNENLFSSSDTQDTELVLHFIGSIRAFLFPGFGYGIENMGDMIAQNVSGVFTVTGGLIGSIDFSETYFHGDIQPQYTSARFYMRAIDGFGPITLTAKANASNAEEVTKTAKGFQIGFRTIVLAL